VTENQCNTENFYSPVRRDNAKLFLVLIDCWGWGTGGSLGSDSSCFVDLRTVQSGSWQRVNVMGNKQTCLFNSESQDKIKKIAVGYSLQDLFVS